MYHCVIKTETMAVLVVRVVQVLMHRKMVKQTRHNFVSIVPQDRQDPPDKLVQSVLEASQEMLVYQLFAE